jgi:arginase
VISRSFRLIEAPSTLGLSTNGVEGSPAALLKLGLAERIGASDSLRLPIPRKESERDPATGVLNAHEIARWSPRLADAVGIALEGGGFPIVLGGDCTIVLGSMLAFRRRGRYGLLFIDGHADFFQPEAEPKGEGASMDLALVTGFGPSLLTDLENLRPIVRPVDVVAFGFRDHEDQRVYGSQPLPHEVPAFDIHRIRQLGAEQAGREAVDYLTRQDVEGFFIHLDADVLDDALMPAVDFRMPGGLSPGELATVLEVTMASEKAVGLEVTIYNPRLDRDGRAGRVLVDVLCKVLSVSKRTSTAGS